MSTDEIWGCLLFNWVAVTLLIDRVPGRAGASTTRVLVLPKMINMNTLKTLYSSTTRVLIFQYSYLYVQYWPQPWYQDRSPSNGLQRNMPYWPPGNKLEEFLILSSADHPHAAAAAPQSTLQWYVQSRTHDTVSSLCRLCQLYLQLNLQFYPITW